jgi:hypothetical protein
VYAEGVLSQKRVWAGVGIKIARSYPNSFFRAV